MWQVRMCIPSVFKTKPKVNNLAPFLLVVCNSSQIYFHFVFKTWKRHSSYMGIGGYLSSQYLFLFCFLQLHTRISKFYLFFRFVTQ